MNSDWLYSNFLYAMSAFVLFTKKKEIECGHFRWPKTYFCLKGKEAFFQLMFDMTSFTKLCVAMSQIFLYFR